MKFKHLKRNGFLFVLLSLLTIGIYSCVVLYHVGKEVNFMEQKHEEKKSRNYVSMWLLGWITLGIVPLIWYCRVANKIDKYANEVEITKPRVDFEVMFNWTVYGLLIVIGPFIGWTKFFKRLNALEAKLNELALKADIIEEAPVEEAPEVAEPEQVAEIAAPVVVSEEVEAEEPKEEKEVKVICKEFASSSSGNKWRVRYSNSPKAIVEFNNKEDAIEYAKYLASRRSHKVTVISKRK